LKHHHDEEGDMGMSLGKRAAKRAGVSTVRERKTGFLGKGERLLGSEPAYGGSLKTERKDYFITTGKEGQWPWWRTRWSLP